MEQRHQLAHKLANHWTYNTHRHTKKVGGFFVSFCAFIGQFTVRVWGEKGKSHPTKVPGLNQTKECSMMCVLTNAPDAPIIAI